MVAPSWTLRVFSYHINLEKYTTDHEHLLQQNRTIQGHRKLAKKKKLRNTYKETQREQEFQ